MSVLRATARIAPSLSAHNRRQNNFETNFHLTLYENVRIILKYIHNAAFSPQMHMLPVSFHDADTTMQPQRGRGGEKRMHPLC